jgi:hypothetical protein
MEEGSATDRAGFEAIALRVTGRCAVSESTGTSRALIEVIVAVVLVVAVAAIVIGVLSWLAGAFWFLLKLAVIGLVIFLVVSLLVRRHR